MPDIVVSGSLIVKLVLFLLLALSVFSWAIILMKLASLREIRRENVVLIRIMDQDKPLDQVWQAATKLGKSNHAAMVKEVCFFLDQKGFFLDMHPQPDAEFTYKDKMEADVNRMSREFVDQEVIRLEENLTYLATIGNIAPFIGLFGTVWGIMNSFRGIAEAGSASLAAVAPGIAEALVATAVGLFAAIPAAAAYNYFLGAIRGQSGSLQKYARKIDAVVKHKSWSVDASIPKAPEAMKT